MNQVQRKFAVFDFDGTLIRWQLFMAIFYELAIEGLIDSKDYDEVHELFDAWKARSSEKAYELYSEKSIEIFDKHVSLLNLEQFDKAVEKVFNKYKDQVYTYTRDLISELKNKGYYLIAISGSQHQIVEKVSKYYGFDEWLGTKYAKEGNKFAGYADFPAGEKGKTLQKIIDKNNLVLNDSIAVGDSEGDIPMLAMVENPIAFNPTKELLAEAKKNGWKIIVERKNVVYELSKNQDHYLLK